MLKGACQPAEGAAAVLVLFPEVRLPLSEERLVFRLPQSARSSPGGSLDLIHRSATGRVSLIALAAPISPSTCTISRAGPRPPIEPESASGFSETPSRT